VVWFGQTKEEPMDNRILEIQRKVRIYDVVMR